MNTKILLTFNGYWREKDLRNTPKVSGIFIVQACSYDFKKLSLTALRILFIGSGSDLNRRITDHKMYKTWKKELNEGEQLLYSIAELDLDTALIREIKLNLINENNPLFNTPKKIDQTKLNNKTLVLKGAFYNLKV